MCCKKTAKKGDAFLGGSCDRQAVRDFCKKVILDGEFVFMVGRVEVVTIYRLVIKRDCMVVCAGGGGAWGVSGMGGCGIMSISEFSSFIDPDSFGIIPFQPKIFRSKLVDFKSFKSNGLAIYVSKINSAKIFRSKLNDL